MTTRRSLFLLQSCLRSLLSPLLAALLVLVATSTSQAQIPGLPPTSSCNPAMQSCMPGVPMPTPGPPRCGPAAGGATCDGNGPASQGNSSNTNQGAGNPINLINGNKYQLEEDLPALPGVLGLEIVRHYNSAYSNADTATGILGRGWKLSYETDLYAIGNTIQIMQADGTRIIFTRDASNRSLCASANPADGRMRVERTKRGEEYLWTWTNGRVLSFNSDGKLVQIAAPTGEFVSLQRDVKGLLVQVTDPQGRQLRLLYPDRKSTAGSARFRGVMAIDSPVGKFSYGYGSTLPQGATADQASVLPNLVTVAYPDNASGRRYHYEDARRPTYLSGISVESKADGKADGKVITQRIGTYLYDINGRGVLTVKGTPARLQTNAEGQLLQPARLVEGAGIGQVTLDFATPGVTVLTNSLGQKTTYRHAIVAGEYRLLEVRGAGCADCGETNVRYGYDRLGRLNETTHLNPVGEAIAGTRTDFDASGRTLRISHIGYAVNATGKPVAASPRPLVRYEYARTDALSPNSPAALSSAEPILIARPSVVAGQEHRVRIEYNAARQPVSITETGFSPALAESAGSVVSGLPQPMSRSTTYRYQSINGRSVLAEIDGPLPNGPKNGPEDSDVTRYMWDARADRTQQIIYPAGLTARFGYHQDSGRIVRVTGVDGIAISLAYSPTGALVRMDRGGASTHYQADALNRITQVLDPTGQRMQLTYNRAGQIASLFDGQDNRIELQRNSEGALIQTQLLNPDGSVAQQGQSYANPLQASDAAQRDAVLAGVGQLIASANAGSNLARPDMNASPSGVVQAFIEAGTQTGFDSAARAASGSATDSQGRTTTYLTDDFGQLRQVDSPVTGITRYTYNFAGQLTARKNADGSQTSYQRDAAGRVTAAQSKTAQGVLDEDATIVWGHANKPARITYLAGEERFAYDDAGRLVDHRQSVDGHPLRLQYRYNVAGQLVAKTLPDGKVLHYRYRGSQHARAGLLESVWLAGLDNASAHRLTGGVLDRPIVQGMNEETDRYAHRNFQFGNGLTNRLMLDARGRVTQAGNAQVGQTLLTYGDADGAKVTARPTDADTALSDSPKHVQSVHPVLLGQRAQSQAAQVMISRVRSAATNWHGSPAALPDAPLFGMSTMVAGGPGDLSVPGFDRQGRQVQHGRFRYTYDSLNRLTRLERAAGDATAEVARYRYNLFGQRIAKTVTLADGKRAKTTHYFYDGSHLVFEGETRTADAKSILSAQSTDSLSPAAHYASTEYVWINDKPIALLRDNQVFTIHTDHRNAPVALTDEARQVVWQAEVADYLHSTPVNQQMLGQIDFNLRGSNQYFDAESGLHYNTHRYFDPVAARYLTPDPLGLAVGPDLYAFALNRPHAVSDPLGLAPIRTNADVVNASFSDRLQYVFEKAARNYPGEIGNALQELVSPQSLALTAAIFGVWAVAQATPAGWAADILLAGVGYVFLGKAIFEVLETFVSTAVKTYSATCLTQLDEAGTLLGRGLANLTVGVGTGAAVIGAPKLASLVKQLLRKPPSGNLTARPGMPPPPIPPPVALDTLRGQQLFGPRLSNVVTRNDGALGEQIAAQILREKTGGTYRGIHNVSGNGPDLIRINHQTRTIEHIEVKSSQVARPGWPDQAAGTPGVRFDTWINEAARGRISNRRLANPADERYAFEIRELLKNGYTVDHKVMQVTIPGPRQTGVPIAELFDWTPIQPRT